mgnify:FL=1
MPKNLLIIALSILFSVILWVFVSLSSDFSTSIDVPIKFFNVPEGFVPDSLSSNQVKVKVKGSGWNIITTLLTSKNEYYVDASKNPRKKNSLELKTFTQENPWLTSKLQVLEVKPDTISFSFEKIGYAKLKVVPVLNLEFKSSYGLASDVIVNPDSVLVSGPIQLVSSLKEIETENLELKSVSERIEREVKLKVLAGLKIEETFAKIILDVQRIVEHSYDDIVVRVTDIPNDRDVVLLPNKITVQLRGGIDVLGKLDKENIIASIPYRDIVLDTLGFVKPIITFPKNTKLVSVKPERLSYVIKKFRK